MTTFKLIQAIFAEDFGWIQQYARKKVYQDVNTEDLKGGLLPVKAGIHQPFQLPSVLTTR
jgi:hypothetical protein